MWRFRCYYFLTWHVKTFVTLFRRDRSWVPAANLRIDDFRKIDVNFEGYESFENLEEPPARMELIMTKSNFVWGAMFDDYMPREVLAISITICLNKISLYSYILG